MSGPTLPPKDPPKTIAAKYLLWIQSNVQGTGTGSCDYHTEKMIVEFPELKRVRGFVQRNDGGGSAHWWCETEDGSIVDPTAQQFWHGIKSYIPLDESKEQPTGYCRRGSICGIPTWNGAAYCSEECEADARAEHDQEVDEINEMLRTSKPGEPLEPWNR